MNSILTSIKKLLGIEEGYTHFDGELIIHINAVFMNLRQLGIGPSIGYFISDASSAWTDFIGDSEKLEAVKLYVYYKIRMSFDPPANSFVLDAMKEQAREIEWRLNAVVEEGSVPDDLPIPDEYEESESFIFDPL